MPRIPQQPYCCRSAKTPKSEYTYIDTTTDIKLKSLEQKLTSQIDTKQAKLTAGDNITIDENNVISATNGSGSAVFTEDFITDETVGHIKSGTEIKKGTSLESVLQDMLKSDVPPTELTMFFYQDACRPEDED